jgi:hypothetical protein
MSLVALAMMLGHVVMFGVAREADQGAAAHTFQLLMIAQVPIMVSFLIKWLPHAPGQIVRMLALQVGTAARSSCACFLSRSLGREGCQRYVV